MILVAALASARPAAADPACDIATDDAASRVYTSITGNTPDCLVRSSSFTGLFVAGRGSVHSRRCKYETIYQCAPATADTPRLAMAAAGWAEADRDGKQTLALAWLREVTLADVVAEDPGDGTFGRKRRFAKPHSRMARDGSLTLRLWVQSSSVSMNPVYSRIEV